MERVFSLEGVPVTRDLGPAKQKQEPNNDYNGSAGGKVTLSLTQDIIISIN